MVKMLLLSPGLVCLPVSLVRECQKYFTAVLSKLHVRMALALDDLPTPQVRSLEGTRRIRVVLWSRVTT